MDNSRTSNAPLTKRRRRHRPNQRKRAKHRRPPSTDAVAVKTESTHNDNDQPNKRVRKQKLTSLKQPATNKADHQTKDAKTKPQDPVTDTNDKAKSLPDILTARNNEKATFEDLPVSIVQFVFSLVDVPSMCNLYIAMEFSSYAEEIAKHLDDRGVTVTAEAVATGDPENISFATLARLPPCHIRVTCNLVNMELTFWHLKQVTVKLVDLHLKNLDKRRRRFHPDLQFLGSTLKTLRLDYFYFFNDRIPTTLTNLHLLQCESYIDLAAFTNLTHIEVIGCLGVSVKELPPLIVSLKMNEVEFDASTLPHIEHVFGDKITNLPWSQVKSAKWVKIPLGQRMDQLTELEINGGPVEKDVEFPKLESVKIKLQDCKNVSNYFTVAQLAQVRILKAKHAMVEILHLLQNLTILHCRFHDELTERSQLPPNLVELSISSSESVWGVPPQLKAFSYTSVIDSKYKFRFNEPTLCVYAESDNLKSLVIKGASSVTVECPNVTHFTCWDPRKIRVDLPNLQSLTYRNSCWPSTQFPFKRGYPNLQELDLRGVSQDVVFDHPMKSVRLDDMRPQRLKFTTDRVHFNKCEIPADTDITARVLKCNSRFLSTRGIRCEELYCNEVDQVPPTVQKLSLSLRESSPYTYIHAKVPELCGCNVLTSLKITGGIWHYRRGLPVPPSVKQVSIWNQHWNRRKQHWEGVFFVTTPTRLEHFEFFDPRYDNCVAFSQQPASVFVENGCPWGQSGLLASFDSTLL